MPSITSAQLTERLRHSNNVTEDKQKLFENTRYFVAQRPASNDFSETIDGYYKGRKVIPGPKANPGLSPILNVWDIKILEAQYFIRFVDDQVTMGADDELKEALFTIMTDSEADEYEAVLLAGHDLPVVGKLLGQQIAAHPQQNPQLVIDLGRGAAVVQAQKQPVPQGLQRLTQDQIAGFCG